MSSLLPARKPDAVILGGGPAGLAAAIALQTSGLQTLVVEAQQPPIDKGCGEGLMPEALEALAALGIDLSPEEGFPLFGIRFQNENHAVAGTFQHGAGIGIRRTRLHQRMIDRALAVGATLRWSTGAELLPEGRLRIDGVDTPYAHLVGADGAASRVRRWAGLDSPRELHHRLGFRRHFRIRPWSESVEIFWSPEGQLYVTPIAPEEVCAVFITSRPRPNRIDFLDYFPAAQARLAGAAQVGAQRGGVSPTRRLHRVHTGTVSLVGDASGSVDAITGEGLSMAFRQASALAGCLALPGAQHARSRDYNHLHHEIGRLPHTMARLLLLMDRHPLLERHGLRTLAAEPALFQDLLAIHTGHQSLSLFALRRAPAIARALLAITRQPGLLPQSEV